MLHDQTAVLHIPYNVESHLIKSLVELLSITDLRFDVTCYGAFLQGLPARIGSSRVLDAAAYAFTTCAADLRCNTQKKGLSLKVLSHYQYALEMLSGSLAGSHVGVVHSHTSHTLCAIYLVMICQV